MVIDVSLTRKTKTPAVIHAEILSVPNERRYLKVTVPAVSLRKWGIY